MVFYIFNKLLIQITFTNRALSVSEISLLLAKLRKKFLLKYSIMNSYRINDGLS